MHNRACVFRSDGIFNHHLLKAVSVTQSVFVCTQEALAPYQHIEEDLKSLKEVLEMKNQQIHQQEVKISELEKLVSVITQWKVKVKYVYIRRLKKGLLPWQQTELPLKKHLVKIKRIRFCLTAPRLLWDFRINFISR